MSLINGLDGYLLLILTLACVIVVAVMVFYVTRKRSIFNDLLNNVRDKDSEKETMEEKISTTLTNLESSSNAKNVEIIKNELRVMDVEKEIVGFALTRLYEAEIEGKITEKDRVQLLEKYKDEMQHLEKEIEKKQMIVKLNDLEETKANLVEILNNKLDEINRSIESIKVGLGIQSIELTLRKNDTTQENRPVETLVEDEKPVQKVSAKSKAEERIEAIQEEVLKVLERLEQIETEE